MKRKAFLILSVISMVLGACGNAAAPSLPGEPTVSQSRPAVSEPTQDAPAESTSQPVADAPGGSTIQPAGDSDDRNPSDPYAQASLFIDTIYAQNGANTIVSPLSLNLALGLVAEGASGQTAEELYAYLGGSNYREEASEYLQYAQKLTVKTDTGLPESPYTFRYQLANSVWVNENRKLQDSFREAVQTYYQAQAQAVDFKTDTDKTAKKINAWCEEKTNGLIPEIVTPNMLSEDLATILINSLYFESPWQDSWNCREHDFTNFAGDSDTREMLFAGTGTYYENDRATAFAQNYYNGFRFIGILPKEEGEFTISDLDLQSLLASETKEYDVRACMPKLNFETSTMSKSINRILQAQGVNLAFDRNHSELDGMIEMEPGEVTYIDDILQKCKIELDENGTRAAAVTAIFTKCESAAVEKPKEVKEVYLDRPFAFLIYDSLYDKILFVGKVIE